MFFSACGQAIPTTPSPIPSSTPTFTPTSTPIPSPTTTATIELTSKPEFVQPTLIPTIDATLVPGLLSKAFSVQTMEGVNGHKIQKITGWDHGYGAGIWEHSCPGFYWLDTDHLLLYPATGQENGGPEGIWRVNVAPQPVIINLKTGNVWLPSEEASALSWSCYPVYWSKKLGILIISGNYEGKSAVFTYTLDGERLAYYSGELASISPSKTKILVGENTLIDLQTGKSITLAWSLEDYHEFILSGLFWTSDEKRVYRCCYFYADLTTGTSQRFERSDLQFTDGTHLDPDGLWFYRGEWVRKDTYFLVEWSWIDDGDIRYLPLLDLDKKLFYDVRERAGISEEWHCQQTMVSPDSTYVWMTGWGEKEEGSYLVNLFTFESHYFPGKEYLHIDWSPNSKFAWMHDPYPTDKTNQYWVLSVADKVIGSLPVKPLPKSEHWWHPTNTVVVYPSIENKLIFLDAAKMSYQELSFVLQDPPYFYGTVAWSPNGEKLALIAEDGSVWQVDYPGFEHLEQLTPPLPDVSDLNWSPNGDSIAFISGLDVYVVETSK